MSEFASQETGQGASLAEYMERDFRQLGRLLDQAEWRAEHQVMPGAQSHYLEFRDRLLRHLELEGRVLEAARGRLSESGVRYTPPPESQEEVREAVRRLESALACADSERFACAASDLREVLADHFQAREHVYQLIDRLWAQAGWHTELLRELRTA